MDNFVLESFSLGGFARPWQILESVAKLITNVVGSLSLAKGGMLSAYNPGSLNIASSLLGGITVPLPEHALAHRRCPAQTVLVKLGGPLPCISCRAQPIRSYKRKTWRAARYRKPGDSEKLRSVKGGGLATDKRG